MDTVVRLPFKLQVIKQCPVFSIQEAVEFRKEEKQVWEEDIITLTVEENDDIDLLFSSNDTKAKLYLEALESIPIYDSNIKEDSNGQVYCIPSEQSFTLYKSNAGYETLWVNTFLISVFCFGEWYYGSFQVLPKPMSKEEWMMMNQQLKQDMTEVSQNLVRKDLTIEQWKAFYYFFIIKKYEKNVISALSHFIQQPYVEKVPCNQVSKGKRNEPYREWNYNNPKNQILKIIFLDYEERLNQVLKVFHQTHDKNILDFRETAIKLKAQLSILKTKEWFKKIEKPTFFYLPNTFLFDIKYQSLYQMYCGLKKEEVPISFDLRFSYLWRKSSYVYEMWCFFRICQSFLSEFKLSGSDWNFDFSNEIFVPFLETGVMMELEDEMVKLKLVFDRSLPTRKAETSLQEPLFIARPYEKIQTHNRPDIVIHVYDKEDDWYLGTIILECKYRKLNSFWSFYPERSSLGQLETYYSNARSEYLYGTLGKRLLSHPVRRVIVLTPDFYGEGVEKEDFHILVKSFKPSNTNEMLLSLKEELKKEIQEMKEISIDLHEMEKGSIVEEENLRRG